MREDLDTIIEQKAKENGWTINNGKTIADSRTFTKGNEHVWFSVYNSPHWRRATIINGRYTNHRSSENLIDFLD